MTVSREVARLLPREDLLYLGDTARVPYGAKSPETVTRYSLENVRFLAGKGAKVIVVACNTASAFALPTLREKFSVPLLGVIEPGVRGALARTRNGKVGVIGTEGTIRSQAYATLLKKFNLKVEVYSVACPLFVPLVEEGWLSGEESGKVAARYLNPLKATGIDTLILGCTHYPLLKGVIRELLGPSVALIDSAEETAKELARLLKTKNLLSQEDRTGKQSFFVTDSPERFARVGSLFLDQNLEGVERVSVESHQ